MIVEGYLLTLQASFQDRTCRVLQLSVDYREIKSGIFKLIAESHVYTISFLSSDRKFPKTFGHTILDVQVSLAVLH